MFAAELARQSAYGPRSVDTLVDAAAVIEAAERKGHERRAGAGTGGHPSASRGSRVEEVPGWRTRGKGTLRPRGMIQHHTAGAHSGEAPSLRTVTFGRAGLRNLLPPGTTCPARASPT